MIKKILPVMLGGMILMGISGCTNPIAAEQDPLDQYPQIHVEDEWLKNDIYVKAPVASRVGAGQLQVDIEIRNKRNEDLKLDYKYYFYDAKGVQIDRDTSWQAVRIPARGVETIEFKSLTASAADFRVELRKREH